MYGGAAGLPNTFANQWGYLILCYEKAASSTVKTIFYTCCISNVHIIYNVFFLRSPFFLGIFPFISFSIKSQFLGITEWCFINNCGISETFFPKGMITKCRVLYLIPFRRSEHIGPNVTLVYKSEQARLQLCRLRKHWYWIDIPKASIRVHETF